MKRIIAVCCLLLTASLLEASSLKPLILNDNPQAPEALVLRSGTIIKIPNATQSRDALANFAKEQNSPIAFFDSKDNMLAFIGTTGIAFMDKNARRNLRTMKIQDVLNHVHRKKMMESAEFAKKYAVENRPKWPDVGVNLPGGIQAIFLERKPAKFVGIESSDKVYVLEIGNPSINKKGIKVKVHTKNEFVKDQGMHTVNHIGYPGAYFLYPREEWHRTLRPDGVATHSELKAMYKNRKSPVLYADDSNNGSFGIVGSKQIMFISPAAFKKLTTTPGRRTRPPLKKQSGYKYASAFSKAKFVPIEEYKEKYADVKNIKPPYPEIPIQADKDVHFAFMKNRPSDYLMVRTFDDRTFVIQITSFIIGDSPDVFRGKKTEIKFKIFEIK